MPPAIEVVRRFRRLRALVIGDAMLDSYLEGTAARLCTEGPVPVVRKTAEERVPGGAANCAANLRALGAGVVFLGLIGRDVTGTLLRSALRERGVDDRWLVEDEGVSTLHKLRVLANGQYVVRFDEGETRTCSPEARRRLIANLEEVFPQCDLVVISDYCYGVASDELIDRLRALRAARPGVLLVDSKNIRRFRRAGATIITPNHLELRLAVGDGQAPVDLPVPAGGFSTPEGLNLSEIERLGRRLLATVDAQHVAVTLAADGVLLLARHGPAMHLPAHPVPQANDVGAGDSFASALALALAAGARCEEAAAIAIDAAGIAVTKQRTAVVQHQELLQRVSLREHALPAPVRALARQIEQERARPDGTPRTIVFTNGVFDILHAGHVEFLRRAKELGDLLVVGVNSDAGARRLKGANRPINSERDRLALVAALDPVDYVALFDEETPAEVIRALRPDIHVKGGDYAGEELPEAEAVREVGGRVVILPLVGDHSTSGVIDRIVAVAADNLNGALR